jgi:hypothetical protein
MKTYAIAIAIALAMAMAPGGAWAKPHHQIKD